jgi:hypothetical protein
MKISYAVFLVFLVSRVCGQVAINTDGALSDSSAILDVKSITKGLLIPRMTQAERDVIMRPANGLLIYCSDNNHFYVNQATAGNKNWVMLADGLAMQQYEPAIIPGAATQFWNGNKLWETLNTQVVPEATVNLYFTRDRVRNTNLSGLTLNSNSIQPSDSIISALGKLQGQVNGRENLLSFIQPLTRTDNAVFIPVSGPASSGYLTSSDWAMFNNKQNGLGYTPENQANKSTNPNLGGSDVLYPTENAVKTFVNGLSGNYIANSSTLQSGTFHITGHGWIQNGNIGIGTIGAPAFQLDINGTSNILRIQTLPLNNSNTSVLVVDDLTGVVSKRTNNFTSGTVTAVTASPPLSSTGGSSPNISIAQSSAVANGYLSSADWNIFNGKEHALTFYSPLSRAANAISLTAASASQNGYLSNSDYSRIHGTSGSVLFYDANGIQHDNANCFFDNANNRLGIGTNVPQAALSVGPASPFQVASDGHCTVSGAFGSISPVTGINTSGTGITGSGTVYGVFGQSNNTSGERAGGYFYTSSSAYARVGGIKQTSPSTFEAYLIWGTGKLITQNKSHDGLMADMVAPVGPETVITDYGSGKLAHGHCHIEIDPLITKRIFVGPKNPIRVFIQLEGDCKGVFVTNKSASGFDVVELMDGTSDATFSWFFTANLNDIVSSDGTIESKNVGVRATEYSTKNMIK